MIAAHLVQARQAVIDERLARHFHQRLGLAVGQRAHALTEARRQDHGSRVRRLALMRGEPAKQEARRWPARFVIAAAIPSRIAADGDHTTDAIPLAADGRDCARDSAKPAAYDANSRACHRAWRDGRRCPISSSPAARRRRHRPSGIPLHRSPGVCLRSAQYSSSSLSASAKSTSTRASWSSEARSKAG